MSGLNWPGLLAWSTKYHDGTAASEFHEMTAEDKEFLTNAMESAFSHIEDLNKTLQEGLAKLDEACGYIRPDAKKPGPAMEPIAESDEQGEQLVTQTTPASSTVTPATGTSEGASSAPVPHPPTGPLPTNSTTALAVSPKNGPAPAPTGPPADYALKNPTLALVALAIIDRCIDDPDCARNLEIFDGIRPLLANALSDYREVSEKCCEILSLFLANNEQMQLAAWRKHSALGLLMGHENKTLKSKARLTLLFNVVRGVEPVTEDFLQRGGLEWVCLVCAKNFFQDSSCSVGERRSIREKVARFCFTIVTEKPARMVETEAALLKFCLGLYEEEMTTDPWGGEAGDHDPPSIQFAETVAQATMAVVQNSQAELLRGEMGGSSLRDAVKKRLEVVLRGGDAASHEIEVTCLQEVLKCFK